MDANTAPRAELVDLNLPRCSIDDVRLFLAVPLSTQPTKKPRGRPERPSESTHLEAENVVHFSALLGNKKTPA